MRRWWLPQRVVALLLVLVHLVVAPLMLPVRAVSFRALDPLYLRLPFEESIAEQDVVVINAPLPMLTGSCLFRYEHEGLPSPRAVRALAPGLSPVTVRRADDQTIEVEADYLGFIDRLFRNEENPLAVGDRVDLKGMTATVLAVTGGRPRRVAFRFEVPLEDASLHWLRFQEGEFVPWTPPEVGEEVILKAEWMSALGL